MTYNMYVYIMYSVYKVDYRGATAPKKCDRQTYVQTYILTDRQIDSWRSFAPK